jgi:hypothetical protein
MRALATLLLALLLPGCSVFSASEGPDPDDVPRSMTLAPGEADVLELTFDVSASGYTLAGTRRTLGAPTLGIVQDRDVLITARDASGHVVQTLSVDNPRLVTTAGSKNPGTGVLDRATLTVRLPSPDTIRIVEVLVRSGPNERESRSFDIPPSDKPR